MKTSVTGQNTENVFNSPIFSDKPSFKERFLNRPITVLRLLVILGIFSGIFIITMVMVIPKFRETKSAHQSEPSTPVATTEAKTKDAPDAKAKQPKESQSQEEGEPHGKAKSPDELDALAKLLAKKEEPVSPAQQPPVAKRDYQPGEIEPPNPNRLHMCAAPLGYGVREGRCVVKVVNGTDRDALVRVMRVDGGERFYRGLYILAGKTCSEESFPAGSYVLKVAFGSDWNGAENGFNYRRSFEKTELFTLNETTTTEPTADGYVYRTRFSNMTITLHKVRDGNFHSSPISEAEFWR